MTFFLKILNLAKATNRHKVNGASGLLYLFAWDRIERAYVYDPKNQNEVDDIYRTMGRTTGYVFCPVNKQPWAKTEIEALIPPVPPPPPPPPPVVTEDIAEQCRNRNLPLESNDTGTIAQRLINAYDLGASDTLESFPRSKAKAPRSNRGKSQADSLNPISAPPSDAAAPGGSEAEQAGGADPLDDDGQ